MKRKRPLPEKEFFDIYSKVTKLVVGLVIKNEKGILLTLRKKNGWINQWHIPGGIVHYREAIKDTVKRIAKEELGVDVSIKKILGYIEYFSEIEERGFGYTVGLVFSVDPENNNFLEGDSKKVEFFKSLPENTVQEEKVFLLDKKLAV